MDFKKAIIAFLVFFNVFSWSIIFGIERQGELEICFFDVGQGDSAFIQTASGHQILIDGGPSDIILEKLSSRMPSYDKTIDLVVLTHPHKDHLYGLLEVLKNYEVDNILWTGINYESSVFERWKQLMEKEKANVFIAREGLIIRFSEDGYFRTIYPFKSLQGETPSQKEINDTSIVLILNSLGDRILFTGDISYKTEAEFLKKDIDVSSDILKVAHQGSKYSSSDEFLETAGPSLAVISVGDNSYGHPSEEALERFKKYNIKVVRTDKNGDICLIQKKKKQFLLLNQTE